MEKYKSRFIEGSASSEVEDIFLKGDFLYSDVTVYAGKLSNVSGVSSALTAHRCNVDIKGNSIVYNNGKSFGGIPVKYITNYQLEKKALKVELNIYGGFITVVFYK